MLSSGVEKSFGGNTPTRITPNSSRGEGGRGETYSYIEESVW